MIGSFSRSWFKTSSSKTWNAKYFHHTVVCTWDCLLTDYNTFLSWSTGLRVSPVHVYTVLSVRVRICEKKGSGHSLKVTLGRIRLTVAILTFPQDG